MLKKILPIISFINTSYSATINSATFSDETNSIAFVNDIKTPSYNNKITLPLSEDLNEFSQGSSSKTASISLTDEGLSKNLNIDELIKQADDINNIDKSLSQKITTEEVKENEDISYRQGMNDLVAILIICLYPYYFNSDENGIKPTKEEIINYINIKDKKELYKNSIKIFKYFHDEAEIECDLFYAFDSLMKKGMKNLFNPKLIQKGESEYNFI